MAYSFSSSLEEVRARLIYRLGFLLIGFGVLAMWYVLVRRDLPFAGVWIPLLLIVFSRGVQILLNQKPALARYVFVWGMVIFLIITLIAFGDPLLPYLTIIWVFISAMLISNSGSISAAIFVVEAAILNQMGIRHYPLLELTIVLVLAASSSWISAYTLFTVVHWYTAMQVRSQQLLETTRDHRAELSQALKSLRSAYETQQHIQLELVWARKHAEDARQLKEQFAANISHELWTPLNLILGFSEMMYLSPDVYGDVVWTPGLRRDIHQIYRNSQHLLGLIGDILDLSRFEMTGFNISTEPTALAPFLQDTLEIVEHSLQGRDIRLTCSAPDDLPVVEIDCTRIRQVILNLLNNACRFTDSGGIELSVQQIEREVVISVRDTGSGISADKLPHIFDEFFQANPSLNRSRGGAGLGLAISKRFVEAHHGRIWAESEEGVGSCFSFALPIWESPVGARAALLDGSTASTEAAFRSVLVLGAESAALALLERSLKDCRVIPIRDARHLPEMVLTHHPKMIIHDLRDDAESVWQEIADLGVPVVECALPRDADVGGAKELGIQAYLTKPINQPTLLGEIDRIGGVRDVLIAFSDRGFALLIERMLQASDHDFVVRQVYDYQQAFAAISAQKPDLVLLDSMAAGSDGLRLLLGTRAQPAYADLPFIVLTTSFSLGESPSETGFMVYQRDGLYASEILKFITAVFEKLSPRYYSVEVSSDVSLSLPSSVSSRT